MHPQFTSFFRIPLTNILGQDRRAILGKSGRYLFRGPNAKKLMRYALDSCLTIPGCWFQL